MHPLRRVTERLAAASHAVYGTRGLLYAAGLLLLLALVEPALGPDFPYVIVTLPTLLLFTNGLFTLPREGVAARQRARALLDREDPVRPMVIRLFWIGLLVLLLTPRLFLGAYGVPHFSPVAGLLAREWMVRVSTVFIYAVMLLPILYLRANRRYAPDIEPRRPKDITEPDSHTARDLLVAAAFILLLVWALLLRPFWSPFSLLQWPPSLSSLDGVRGLHALAFSLAVPLPLFMGLAAHLDLLRVLWRDGRWRRQRAVAALAAGHVLLITMATFLHAYDLLWVVRYEALTSL